MEFVQPHNLDAALGNVRVRTGKPAETVFSHAVSTKPVSWGNQQMLYVIVYSLKVGLSVSKTWPSQSVCFKKMKYLPDLIC